MAGEEGRSERHWALGVVGRLALAFVLLALVTHTLARPFVVPSESMEPTLRPGDRIVTQVVGVDEDDIARQEVIAFAHGQTWEEERLEEPNPWKKVVRTGGDVLGVGPSHHAHTVKRVIGLPGETVSCCDDQGRVLVDGEPLEEPYITKDLPFPEGQECSDGGAGPARCFAEVTVPQGSYLVLGDHRANSADSVSSCRGQPEERSCTPRFVRADQVVGTVGWRVWPLPPGGALREE